MKFVSYYTPDYEKYVGGLVHSFQRFHLDYDVEMVEDRGSWFENTFIKPEFILEKLETHNEPIVWIDIDATVKEYPSLLFQLKKQDFAARFNPWLMSGTLYFNNTMKARKLLRRWKEAPRWKNDQRTLEKVIKDDDTIIELPKSYCIKYDEKGEVVIKHWMGSRKRNRAKK